VLRIFVGADGLRAGWGILLFVAIFVALLTAFGALLVVLQKHGAMPLQTHAGTPTVPVSPQYIYTEEGAPLLATLLATWIMARIERRPLTAYGLRPQYRLRNFCFGLGWGVTLLSLLVVFLRATGFLVFDTRLLFGTSAFRYGAIWFCGFLLVGLFEETLTRGYLQFTLARGLGGAYRHLVGAENSSAIGFWGAAFLLSFAFGFVHRTNPGESPIGELSAGLIGLVFCLSLWRTGSLWWAIGLHAAWDWAQSFLYGVADSGGFVEHRLFATHPVGQPILSGGLTGPEGSIYVVPVIALAAVIALLTLPRTPFVFPPPSAPEPSLH
jgi:membrane protease YdiL (CAAX protease family)